MKKEKKHILGVLFGISIISIYLLRMQQNCINRWKQLSEKNRALFLLMDQWLRIKQDGKKIESYLIKNNLRRIAIYGMSTVGMRLLKELKNSSVEVIYGIDRNAENIYCELKIVTVDEVLPEADAVIVTLVKGYDKICELLSGKVNCPVIAIEDIINEI